MSLDITQLQAAIANAEQVIDALAPMIPGPLGDKVRAVVGLVETLDKNPLLLQVIVYLINNIDQLKNVKSLQELVGKFDVSTTVA